MPFNMRSRLMIGGSQKPRGASLVLVATAVWIAALGGCGDEPSEVSTAAGDDLTLTPSALPDRSLDALVTGVAGGFGWLVRSDDPATLWRVAPDGSAAEARGAFADVQVGAMGSLDGGLVVSGQRCHGAAESEGVEDGCESTSGIVQLIEPTGALRWEVELTSLDGAPDNLVVALVGATDEELWVWPTNGDLAAINRSGEITSQVPAVNGDPCVLGEDLYMLAEDLPLPESDAGEAPSTPPIAQAPSPAAETTYVVRATTGGEWRDVEDSRRTFTGSAPFGQCIDGGFEVSLAGAPVARWTVESGAWDTLPTETQRSDAAASSEPTFDDEIFALDPATGVVLHRGDDLAYATTDISFSFARQPLAPVALMIASDDELVFACAQAAPTEGGESMCGFGRTSS